MYPTTNTNKSDLDTSTRSTPTTYYVRASSSQSMAGLPLTRSGIQRTLRHRIPFPSRSPTLQHRTFGSSSAPSSSSFRTAGYTLLVALSAGLFTTYYLDARSAIHRYVFTPVLRYAVDAETGHKLAVKVLRSGLAPRDPIEDDASLRSHVGHVSGHGKSWEC